MENAPFRLFAGPHTRKEASPRTQAKQHAHEVANSTEGRDERAVLTLKRQVAQR